MVDFGSGRPAKYAFAAIAGDYCLTGLKVELAHDSCITDFGYSEGHLRTERVCDQRIFNATVAKDPPTVPHRIRSLPANVRAEQGSWRYLGRHRLVTVETVEAYFHL